MFATLTVATSFNHAYSPDQPLGRTSGKTLLVCFLLFLSYYETLSSTPSHHQSLRPTPYHRDYIPSHSRRLGTSRRTRYFRDVALLRHKAETSSKFSRTLLCSRDGTPRQREFFLPHRYSLGISIFIPCNFAISSACSTRFLQTTSQGLAATTVFITSGGMQFSHILRQLGISGQTSGALLLTDECSQPTLEGA